jgi:hypothetical protein
MASITQAQLSADMDHALEDFGVTLTVVLPSGYTGTTFSATRTSITQGFILETNGRDVQIDSAFYLNLVSLSPVPEKGWIVNDGTRDLKIAMTDKDPSRSSLKIDCVRRHSN